MIEVKAQLSNLRVSPQKVRLVADTIRGLEVERALGLLDYDLRDVSPVIAKLVRSAVANAKHNHDYTGTLFVSEIQVGEGPTLKRWRPRAYGRASKIMKRTSKIFVMLSDMDGATTEAVAATEDKPTPKKETPTKSEAPSNKATVSDASGDDLTKIEGIGPKIAETLTKAGVATYADLADQTPEKIAEIITDVRGNHDPSTWPEQSAMARDGKWDALKEWQDALDGGKA